MKKPYMGPGIRISGLKIEGPFIDEWPPRSIQTTFDSNTIPNLADSAVRQQVLLRFAKRAFRRPVSKSEISPYIEYLNNHQSDGGRANHSDWHEATLQTFAAMMGSADFLYIREGQAELNGYELANRLSYFLWSTMPDVELFELAKSGKLKDPEVLRQQVVRLLTDKRANRFCDSFADQWLALNELGTMPPDGKSKEFRDYYRDNLESAMLEETHRYFRYVLRENQSVLDFVDSDYSFVNKGLAKLYGVRVAELPANAKRNQFARVTFPASSRRGGLLGHASILTLTANGVETSPVERGVWVLADLLGTPPPPPPKEVPAITPDLNGAKTVRDLLEKHRSDIACMECHRRIDPPGFALEAYDPIGRLRSKYSKTQTVSTQGNFKGQDFANVDELKKILASDIRPFARNLVIRIAEYAKGRKLIATDYSTVEAILEANKERDFKLKDLVIAIATSELLRNR